MKKALNNIDSDDFKEEITTRQTQDDPVRAALKEEVRLTDPFTAKNTIGWAGYEAEKINDYLHAACSRYKEDENLQALGHALENYANRDSEIWKNALIRFQELAENHAYIKGTDVEKERRFRMSQDKFIPTSMEAQFDGYKSVQEKIDEFEGEYNGQDQLPFDKPKEQEPEFEY
jgi:hypothetical protein